MNPPSVKFERRQKASPNVLKTSKCFGGAKETEDGEFVKVGILDKYFNSSKGGTARATAAAADALRNLPPPDEIHLPGVFFCYC